jgi:hypothetical protein
LASLFVATPREIVYEKIIHPAVPYEKGFGMQRPIFILTS